GEDPTLAAVDEVGRALGVFPHALECLKEDDGGGMTWVQFRFAINKAELCLKSPDQVDGCSEPQDRERARANQDELKRLEAIVTFNSGRFHRLVAYSFATDEGGGQSNLELSGKRAAIVENHIVKNLLEGPRESNAFAMAFPKIDPARIKPNAL